MIRLPSATAGRQTKHSIEQEFRADVLRGLSASPKRLPCKYFYDERGSQLFDAICELDEYYLTRAELAIMRRDAGEMAQSIGDGVMAHRIRQRQQYENSAAARRVDRAAGVCAGRYFARAFVGGGSTAVAAVSAR